MSSEGRKKISYYEILRVSRGASAAEIRRAYKQLALQQHPDKNSATDATSNFQQIQEAYETLSSRRRRELYDAGLDGRVLNLDLQKTRLMEACRRGDADEVSDLIKSGEDVEAIDSTLRTALMYAAGSGSVQAVLLLLEAGADVGARNCAGHTALFFAVGARGGGSYLDPIPCFKLLLDAGIDVNAATAYGLTALMLTCATGNAAAVEYLLARGASATALSDIGLSPLVFASDKGHAEVVRVLLAARAAVDERYAKGKTALMAASALAHEEVVVELLAARADANAKTESGTTPLLFVMERSLKDGLVCPADSLEKPRSSAVVGHLLGTGADPEAAGDDGRTPLRLAVLAGDLAAAEMLLWSGADPSREERDGQSPIDIETSGEMRELLRSSVCRSGPRTQSSSCCGCVAGLYKLL